MKHSFFQCLGKPRRGALSTTHIIYKSVCLYNSVLNYLNFFFTFEKEKRKVRCRLVFVVSIAHKIQLGTLD